MRAFGAVVLAAVSPATAVAAQDSPGLGPRGQLCYRARPKPACSAFILTNFGGYVVLTKQRGVGTPLRAVADWGLMANVGARDAIGGSVFASLDREGLGLGPAARYRRWIPPAGSFEVAVGAPLLVPVMWGQTVAVFGLLKWSPNQWLAVAARPEILRAPYYDVRTVRSPVRMSVGAEAGGLPGLALTGAGIAAGIVVVLVGILQSSN